MRAEGRLARVCQTNLYHSRSFERIAIVAQLRRYRTAWLGGPDGILVENLRWRERAVNFGHGAASLGCAVFESDQSRFIRA
jgi:hypothetical protein